MSLLDLPPEILCHIFEDVGATYFKQDIGRLMVSKQWCAVARWGIFRNVTLRARSLHKLLSLHASGSEILAPSLDYLKRLAIKLAGYEGVEAPDRKRFSAALNADLVQLGPLVRNAPRLKSLHVRASRWVHPDDDEHSVSYLSIPAVHALLEVPIHLEVLVLDITTSLSAPPLPSGDSPAPGFHACSVIGSLLPTLRVLHVRMSSICSDVLVPPNADALDSIRLEEVVVNTSLKETDNLGNLSTYHARLCGHRTTTVRLLWEKLYEKAELLAARMQSPKTVRIIKHRLPTFRLISMDVLTGAEMELTDSQAWGADGKVIESPPEPESSISSISDFE
ncbi:hypothetical protein F503_04869 [Ophiostoma piceae UAMH 11346]|uniref:Uncharacterized protein n=1 Tax=Ophiostoma piceae (strain UAMH 11346) TaxID=1262450 RepID=S3BX28_OPHP1|nr:hypothetical protein F503_04869 [Ophiostoma piceae UAMH 11346]